MLLLAGQFHGSGPILCSGLALRGGAGSQLSNCVPMLYHVSTTSFMPSGQGVNGSFMGTGINIYSGDYIIDQISVTNDVTKYSIDDMNPGVQFIDGRCFVTIGEIVPDNPVANYSASNGSARNIQEADLVELGDSLGLITGEYMHDQEKQLDNSSGGLRAQTSMTVF